MKRISLFFMLLCYAFVSQADYLVDAGQAGFVLADKSGATPIIVEDTASAGVKRVATSFANDIFKVSSQKAEISSTLTKQKSVVLVAELGKSRLLAQLIANNKIDVSDLEGRWDGFLIEHVTAPFEGVDEAWVVAGANHRGAMYGMYDISETIGVSPWYWWADVPVKKSATLILQTGTRKLDAPAVKYRGIFLNDEAPALTNWAAEKFGGFNAQFYEHVFELLLRLKANFLWPAMWNNAFADDDPQNARLAHEMGIVMSTSHHEPMMRADKEWNRYGEGKWEYSTNPENLASFWKEGAERHKNLESIFTLGMRGQEDTPMSEGQNIGLLEKIVSDQRAILDETFDKPVEDIPQVWALYKEVQGFYERGMRVPDDVTLLWTDDNFGNIRRLPTPQERERTGGAGVYYHFDYVGGPRSYRWINTVPLGKIYEQMSMAWEYGAREIWITNVGDLKPMELPIDFFLSMAWDPESFNGSSASTFTHEWAKQQFPAQYVGTVAELINTYTMHNGRRKPEAITPQTYSIDYYDEAQTISTQLQAASKQAERLEAALPDAYKNAFFQLVGYPLWASQAVFELNHAKAINTRDANQDRATTNQSAALTKQWFERDEVLSERFHTMDNGRWNHMMSQPHIGFVHWRNPPANIPPVVSTKALAKPAIADMGVTTENQAAFWPASEWQSNALALKTFTPFGKRQRDITIYNRQGKPFEFTIESEANWIRLSQKKGTVEQAATVLVSIDWSQLPPGEHQASVLIKGTGWGGATVDISANNQRGEAEGFVEADGVLSVNAVSGTIINNRDDVKWEKLTLHGRTGSAIRSFISAGATPAQNVSERPALRYPLYFFSTGTFDVSIDISPTQSFFPDHQLAFWMALDNAEPEKIKGLGKKDSWGEEVLNNARQLQATITVNKPGAHTLSFYPEDTGVVLQKIVVDTGGLEPSYLGPPESPLIEQ